VRTQDWRHSLVDSKSMEMDKQSNHLMGGLSAKNSNDKRKGIFEK
jgi:hypothetical protein